MTMVRRSGFFAVIWLLLVAVPRPQPSFAVTKNCNTPACVKVGFVADAMGRNTLCSLHFYGENKCFGWSTTFANVMYGKDSLGGVVATTTSGYNLECDGTLDCPLSGRPGSGTVTVNSFTGMRNNVTSFYTDCQTK